MDEVTCFIGIDVGQARLDAHVLPAGASRAVGNAGRGLQDVSRRDVIHTL